MRSDVRTLQIDHGRIVVDQHSETLLIARCNEGNESHRTCVFFIAVPRTRRSARQGRSGRCESGAGRRLPATLAARGIAYCAPWHLRPLLPDLSQRCGCSTAPAPSYADTGPRDCPNVSVRSRPERRCAAAERTSVPADNPRPAKPPRVPMVPSPDSGNSGLTCRRDLEPESRGPSLESFLRDGHPATSAAERRKSRPVAAGVRAALPQCTGPHPRWVGRTAVPAWHRPTIDRRSFPPFAAPI